MAGPRPGPSSCAGSGFPVALRAPFKDVALRPVPATARPPARSHPRPPGPTAPAPQCTAGPRGDPSALGLVGRPSGGDGPPRSWASRGAQCPTAGDGHVGGSPLPDAGRFRFRCASCSGRCGTRGRRPRERAPPGGRTWASGPPVSTAWPRLRPRSSATEATAPGDTVVSAAAFLPVPSAVKGQARDRGSRWPSPWSPQPRRGASCLAPSFGVWLGRPTCPSGS